MTILFVTAVLLMACSDKTDPSEKSSASQPEKNNDTEESSEINKKEDESESTTDDSNKTSSEEARNKESSNTSESEKDNALSEFSSEKVEYARVWLQLGPNQEIDELNVRHISAGEPLNPDDDTSANYPEDVIELAGSRLVDGSVTYSGNGDGTINVYNVPLRWDGKYPAGEKFYIDIIENTKLVSIDPGDDKEIIKLIELLNIHS